MSSTASRRSFGTVHKTVRNPPCMTVASCGTKCPMLVWFPSCTTSSGHRTATKIRPGPWLSTVSPVPLQQGCYVHPAIGALAQDQDTLDSFTIFKLRNASQMVLRDVGLPLFVYDRRMPKVEATYQRKRTRDTSRNGNSPGC